MTDISELLSSASPDHRDTLLQAIAEGTREAVGERVTYAMNVSLHPIERLVKDAINSAVYAWLDDNKDDVLDALSTDDD